MLDLKITGGTIVDGSGKPRFVGDVGVQAGKIVATGTVEGDARQNVHATGQLVCPGFTAAHHHHDAPVF